MKLLLDEMHSPRVADALRSQGWDAIAVAAESTLRGRPDTELFEFAIETGRVIVTEDSGGFIRLANLGSVEGKPHYGLIITSRSRFPPRIGRLSKHSHRSTAHFSRRASG